MTEEGGWAAHPIYLWVHSRPKPLWFLPTLSQLPMHECFIIFIPSGILGVAWRIIYKPNQYVLGMTWVDADWWISDICRWVNEIMNLFRVRRCNVCIFHLSSFVYGIYQVHNVDDLLLVFSAPHDSSELVEQGEDNERSDSVSSNSAKKMQKKRKSRGLSLVPSESF